MGALHSLSVISLLSLNSLYIFQHLPSLTSLQHHHCTTSTLLSIMLLSRATLQPCLSVSLKVSVDIVTDVAHGFVCLNVCVCMHACLHAWALLGMKTVGLSVFVAY